MRRAENKKNKKKFKVLTNKSGVDQRQTNQRMKMIKKKKDKNLTFNRLRNPIEIRWKPIKQPSIYNSSMARDYGSEKFQMKNERQ